MKEHDINYNGVLMTVRGVYYKACEGIWLDPDEPHEFNCLEVNIEGIDIMKLLSDDIITEIENQVLTENY